MALRECEGEGENMECLDGNSLLHAYTIVSSLGMSGFSIFCDVPHESLLFSATVTNAATRSLASPRYASRSYFQTSQLLPSRAHAVPINFSLHHDLH